MVKAVAVVSLFLVLGIIASATATMDAKGLSAAVTKFSARFCNELDQSKSVVSSPLSAEFVLALLTLGTSEPAHSELLTSLGIPSDDAIRSSFSEVTSKLKKLKGVTLKVANKVYIMEGGYDLQPALKSDAQKVFDAAFEKVDFAKSEAAANLINEWVENKTNNKIKRLLSPDSLNSDSRLVLVNAIYFKGSWSKKFNSDFTQDLPFNVDSKTQINVPMMYQQSDFRYGESEELQAQLLQMQYEGGDANMLIVLPNEIEGLPGVMKKIAEGFDLVNFMSRMSTTKVQVTIPKFKIETEIDLGALLPKLGIKAIFDPGNSGLTKILNADEPLYVSKAVQKAFIEVNEEGAEAAAATGMVVMMRTACRMPPPFHADRPFLYLLTGSDDTPLVIGVYQG